MPNARRSDACTDVATGEQARHSKGTLPIAGDVAEAARAGHLLKTRGRLALGGTLRRPVGSIEFQ